ncbi:hypothetical protein T492DRAFT_851094 [Pavlovales sp. CCMP2436]|nr:hypothetical protein T492DRAFT_851094 [Pavlovales sp. CCMP2436]
MLTIGRVLLCAALCAPAGAMRTAAARSRARSSPIASARRRASPLAVATNKNVEQTLDTNREKIMTFVYDDDNTDPTARRQRKGTTSGLSGKDLPTDEYDTIVIGSGVGGLSCGALSAKYGDKVLVLEAHAKPGGSAHTFTRMHNGGEFSFEAAFEQTLLDRCGADGPLAIQQWKALGKRLKTLSGSTQAVSLLNLRQDAGFLATTAGSFPYVVTHPDIMGDLTMLFDSLHKVVDDPDVMGDLTMLFDSLHKVVDEMCRGNIDLAIPLLMNPNHGAVEGS